MRALAGAIALGSSAGLVIGGAYLAGSAHHASLHPAPAVSGQLQARNVTRVRKDGPPPPVVVAPVASLEARPSTPLRDRFRIAVEAMRTSARPFRFQAVADAPSDLHCLAEVVYFEARGEAPAGQQAVAQVVLNRVRHPAFPKTICAVVHQHTGSGCQFSFACGSRQVALDSTAWRRAEAIASSEMHGAVMTAVGDATHFQAARSSPFAGLLKVAQVGAHIFYRFGGRNGAPAMFHQTPAASSAPKVELARLEPVAAPQLTPPASVDHRVKVTLYVGPASASPAATPPGGPVAPTPRPAAVARIAPVPAATPAGKSPELTAVKPPVIAVALAQS